MIIAVVQNVTFVGIILLFFYRDPERNPPQDPMAIVSPADGRIIYVERREAGDLLKAEKKGIKIILDEIKNHDLSKETLLQMGISMVYTDVHVNRAPIRGKVTFLHYRPGKYLSLRKPQAANSNERQTMLIENERTVAIVQVSRFVRKFRRLLEKIQRWKWGKIGRVIFGSQVDIFIPINLVDNIEVDPGEYVFAGETILCRMKPSVRREPAR
jgi:phosphatidylserine decarboxylase